MTATISRVSIALFVAAACAASAHAKYVCDSQPVGIDLRACQAAAQGPDALRRLVNSWVGQMSNLYFADYVDPKTAQNWDANRRQMAEQKDTIEDAQKVASSERR
jgi:hypothetical protein